MDDVNQLRFGLAGVGGFGLVLGGGPLRVGLLTDSSEVGGVPSLSDLGLSSVNKKSLFSLATSSFFLFFFSDSVSITPRGSAEGSLTRTSNFAGFGKDSDIFSVLSEMALCPTTDE